MNIKIFIFIMLYTQIILTQEMSTNCILDTSSINTAQIDPLVNVTDSLVVILVDFPDGRKPDGSLPIVDADTLFFTGDSIDAVGGMSYIKVGNPPIWKKKILKYTYDDYWNMFFSVNTYYDDSLRGIHPHPDYFSHNIKVYGSFRDYYNEVSYGKYRVIPARTRSGPNDKYHTGIINRIDTADGKRYIRWIKMPLPKTSYSSTSLRLISDAIDQVKALNALEPSHPDYIEFNSWGKKIKYAIILAGGAKGGFTRFLGDSAYCTSEKQPNRKNTDPKSALDGIQAHIHEYGHLIKIHHFVAGNYCSMHWGGLVSGLSEPWYSNYYYSPPHFNPWIKYLLGWVNVTTVSTDTTVSITAINDSNLIVRVNVKPGGWTDGEYFLVEYRKRSGFNRFAGGISTPGFNGGALIWHYSGRYGYFNIGGGFVDTRLGLKVENYDFVYNYFKGNTGDPAHFYPEHGTGLNSITNPNSHSIDKKPSRIALENFKFENNKLSFDVYYNAWVGNITENTTWQNRVNVMDNITIQSGVTLTINPSTRVVFGNGKNKEIII